LYQPKSGEILIDGDILKAEQWNEYRQLFSAIFSDFHVFRQLIDGQGEDANQAEIDEWLKRLGMDDKVTTENNRLSAVDFSQGQKKRLALLMAVLEKRDCLLLDEWAADQDPQFRHFFYNQLLPLLAKQGKTIIAITHDDHYFDGADRILKMDEGRLLELTASERQALNKLAHSNNEITYLVAE
jgi:putative ATP-binding cassette transporter